MSLVKELGGALATGSSRDVERGSLTLAKVTNIKDEKGLDRVKCLPIGGAKEEETDWCYVMTPMGGPSRGLCLFPQVDDLVVLAYLGDDPHRPIVLGSFWDKEQPSPCPIEDGKVQDYALKTPKGVSILLHDEDKKQSVTLTLPSGATIRVDDGAKKLEIHDKKSENALTMDLEKGDISIQAKNSLTLASSGATIVMKDGISVKAKGKLEVKSDGSATLNGSAIEAKSSGKLALQGAMVQVKADGKLDLSASGPASVKGAILKLN